MATNADEVVNPSKLKKSKSDLGQQAKATDGPGVQTQAAFPHTSASSLPPAHPQGAQDQKAVSRRILDKADKVWFSLQNRMHELNGRYGDYRHVIMGLKSPKQRQFAAQGVLSWTENFNNKSQGYLQELDTAMRMTRAQDKLYNRIGTLGHSDIWHPDVMVYDRDAEIHKELSFKRDAKGQKVKNKKGKYQSANVEFPKKRTHIEIKRTDGEGDTGRRYVQDLSINALGQLQARSSPNVEEYWAEIHAPNLLAQEKRTGKKGAVLSTHEELLQDWDKEHSQPNTSIKIYPAGGQLMPHSAKSSAPTGSDLSDPGEVKSMDLEEDEPEDDEFRDEDLLFSTPRERPNRSSPKPIHGVGSPLLSSKKRNIHKSETESLLVGNRSLDDSPKPPERAPKKKKKLLLSRRKGALQKPFHKAPANEELSDMELSGGSDFD